MLVYIDIKNQNVQIYTNKGIKEYHFDEIDYVIDDIGKVPCKYVTNIMDTDMGAVVDTVKSLAPNSNVNSTLNSMDSKMHFVHSTIPGVLQIPIDENKVITFNGTGDCKILDEKLYALIKSTFAIRQMLKQGKLEIITEDQMRKHVRISNREKAKTKSRFAAKDAQLKSIIIGDGTPGSAELIAENMFNESGDDEGYVDIGAEEKKVSIEDVLSGRADPSMADLELLEDE